MSPESAEMTKYAANAMLATKISFINEMANLCDRVGADVNDVRRGIGHDQRIGFQFLFPGPGYGGSCFPKDVRAIVSLARQHDLPLHLMTAVDSVNEAQKQVLVRKVKKHFGDKLSGKTLAIWGLAFKPRTDDMREAPAIVIIDRLLGLGAAIRAYDPEADATARRIFGNRIVICEKSYDALEGADALAVVTEWNTFREPDFDRMKRLMRAPVVFDGRNVYSPEQMRNLGFTYFSIGR
jgi:UDPglucose 6-dehydrogenase